MLLGHNIRPGTVIYRLNVFFNEGCPIVKLTLEEVVKRVGGYARRSVCGVLDGVTNRRAPQVCLSYSNHLGR